ncbi:hypothetical protein [Cellulomonas sp. GbtcB1]|uniref:hypothetical protein n=1 Tax=Cellulomonas sp. GbtcB1 TaxID=2824746 RepID=UPI001C2F83D5|nr:hypothetical protein [Cellulomonas sp. GbtcB1]
MTFDLSRALDEIADDAGAHGRPADPGRVVALRRRRRVVRRGVGAVGALAVTGVLVLTGATLADWRAPDPLPAAPEPTTSAPEPAPEPDPGETPDPGVPSTSNPPVTPGVQATERPAADSAPLADPGVSRWDGESSLVSDAPTSGDGLEDGDFFGSVLAVDPVARTITVDLGIFYGGDAATTWAQEHEPELLENDGPHSGYVIVDDVPRSRTLALAPDAVVTGYCQLPEAVVQQPRDLGGLTGPEPAGCADASRVDGSVGGRARFWVDVRGGQVAQLAGQFLP